MASSSCMPREAARSWAPDSIYCEATCAPEDVYYVGSDDDDYENPEVRRRRYAAAGQRFLNGDLPFILSAGLNGPFDSFSGWTNPWRSKRQSATNAATKKAALAKAPRRVKTKHSTPSQLPQTQESHLPSPESLKQVSVKPHPYLEEDSLARVNSWRTNVEPLDATKDVFWSDTTLGSREHASAKKKRARGSDWLQKTPSKKQKTFRDATDPIQTPSNRRSRTVPVSSTKSPSKSYMKACVSSSFRSAPERLGSLDNASNQRQNSLIPGDEDELMDGPSSSFATAPVKSSSPTKRVSPKRAVWKVKGSDPVESEDELAHVKDANMKAAATLSSPVSLKGSKKLKGKQRSPTKSKPTAPTLMDNDTPAAESLPQPITRESPACMIEDEYDGSNDEVIDMTNPNDDFEEAPAQTMPELETTEDKEPPIVGKAVAIATAEKATAEDQMPEETTLAIDETHAVAQPRESSPLSSVSSPFDSESWAGLSSVGKDEAIITASNDKDDSSDTSGASESVDDSEDQDISDAIIETAPEVTKADRTAAPAIAADHEDTGSDTDSVSELSEASSMEDMAMTILYEDSMGGDVQQADDTTSEADSDGDSDSDSMSELSEPSSIASSDFQSDIINSQLREDSPEDIPAPDSITVTVHDGSRAIDDMDDPSEEDSVSDAETESSVQSVVSSKVADATSDGQGETVDSAGIAETVVQELQMEPCDQSDDEEVLSQHDTEATNETTAEVNMEDAYQELPVYASASADVDNASSPGSDKDFVEATEHAEAVNDSHLVDDNEELSKVESHNPTIDTENTPVVAKTPELSSGSFSFRNMLERIVPLSPWRKSISTEVPDYDKTQDTNVAPEHLEETASEDSSTNSESYAEVADEDVTRQLQITDNSDAAPPTGDEPENMELCVNSPPAINPETSCEDTSMLEAQSSANDQSVSRDSPAAESPCCSGSQTGSEAYEDAIAEQLAPSQQSPWSKSQNTQLLGEALSAMAAQALRVESTPEELKETAVEVQAPQVEEVIQSPSCEEPVASADVNEQPNTSVAQDLPAEPQPAQSNRPTPPARPTTPEPEFMMPSFSAFMTPSPEYRARQRQRAKGRVSSGRVVKVQHSLPSALKTPWSSGKGGRRITWAPLPNENKESEDLVEARTTERQASPPPMTAVEDLPTGKDAEFQGHFNVVAKRAADTPRRIAPTDSQESQVSDEDSAPVTTPPDAPVEKPTNFHVAPVISMFDTVDEETGEEDGMDLTAQVFEDLEDLLRPWDMDAELDEVRKEPGYDAMEIDV